MMDQLLECDSELEMYLLLFFKINLNIQKEKQRGFVLPKLSSKQIESDLTGFNRANEH